MAEDGAEDEEWLLSLTQPDLTSEQSRAFYAPSSRARGNGNDDIIDDSDMDDEVSDDDEVPSGDRGAYIIDHSLGSDDEAIHRGTSDSIGLALVLPLTAPMIAAGDTEPNSPATEFAVAMAQDEHGREHEYKHDRLDEIDEHPIHTSDTPRVSFPLSPLPSPFHPPALVPARSDNGDCGRVGNGPSLAHSLLIRCSICGEWMTGGQSCALAFARCGHVFHAHHMGHWCGCPQCDCADYVQPDVLALSAKQRKLLTLYYEPLEVARVMLYGDQVQSIARTQSDVEAVEYEVRSQIADIQQQTLEKLQLDQQIRALSATVRAQAATVRAHRNEVQQLESQVSRLAQQQRDVHQACDRYRNHIHALSTQIAQCNAELPDMDQRDSIASHNHSHTPAVDGLLPAVSKSPLSLALPGSVSASLLSKQLARLDHLRASLLQQAGARREHAIRDTHAAERVRHLVKERLELIDSEELRQTRLKRKVEQRKHEMLLIEKQQQNHRHQHHHPLHQSNQSQSQSQPHCQSQSVHAIRPRVVHAQSTLPGSLLRSTAAVVSADHQPVTVTLSSVRHSLAQPHSLVTPTDQRAAAFSAARAPLKRAPLPAAVKKKPATGETTIQHFFT